MHAVQSFHKECLINEPIENAIQLLSSLATTNILNTKSTQNKWNWSKKKQKPTTEHEETVCGM